MQNRFLRRALPALALCLALSAEVTPERLDQQVKAYAAQQKFNGAVLVVKDGKPLLNKGYGMANIEWQIPVTPSTKFRLGSITKQFTGMCVMLLEQDGKLSVNDPVSKYVPDAPAAWQQITIHHLLTHTSGIPNFTSFPDYTKTMMLESPPAESMKKFRDKPLDFDPGTKFSYSNSGYVLLGYIIEKVSGMPYDRFIKQRVFDPLEMKDTGYDWNQTILANRASGYEIGPQGIVNARYIHMSIPHAAGALYSTTEDLAKWDRALSAGRLLNAENMKRYFTPFKDGYAYGWTVASAEGKQVISHGGGINGFSTMITRIPEEKLLVVTLTNVVPSQAGRVATELSQLVLGKEVALPLERKEISLDTKALDEYVGDYELSPTFMLKVTREGNNLITIATGQPPVQVFAEAKDKFFLKVVDAQLTFTRDAEGKITGLTLHQNGRNMPAKRK